MHKKPFIISIAIITIISVFAVVYMWRSESAGSPAAEETMTSESATQPSESVSSPSSDPAEPSAPSSVAEGRYAEYQAELVADDGYDSTILFFYAPWCPECVAFDGELANGTVPAGTQILRVDYDSNQDLRKKYGVTTQSTFVRVDATGAKQGLWAGYGRTKSVDAVIENTQ